MVSSSISNSGNVSSSKDSNFNFTTKADSNGLDFNKIMTKSIASSTNTQSNEFTSKQTASKVTTSSKTASAKETKDVKDDKNTNDLKNTKDVKDTDDTKVIKDNKNVNDHTDVKDTKDINQKLNESDDKKIDELTDAIKDKIKKTFGISDEQLETALANLGITMQDLLKPVNLTNFVCEITGTKDSLTLLTDSGLSEQFKSVMDFIDSQVNNLAQDMNISLDDLKAYIEDSNSTKQNQTVDVNANQIQADENMGMMKVQSEDASKNINNEETTKTNSNEQSENDLQSVIETKVTIDSEQDSKGSMSKNGNESGEKNHEFNAVTNNLSQSIQNAFDKIITEGESKINTVDVIKQIVEAAKVTVTQDVSSMEIQLNPENLGKINLSVVAKDGVITAQITAENESVKKAIENQMSVLKENFNNQGIKVEAIEVTIASHSFESNQNLGKDDTNQDTNGKSTNKPLKLDSIEDLQDDELSDEERRVMHLLKSNSSSVEYSA